MTKKEELKPKLGEGLENLNELEYFRLFITDEILDGFAQESTNYYNKKLIEQYGVDYRKTVLGSYGKGNSLPYLFVSKGISKEDILAFMGMQIYMGLHHLADIKSYWTNVTPFKNGTILSKNYFFLLSKAIHFPDKEKDNNNPGKEPKYENSTKIGPKHQMNLYLEKLSKNFQKYYELGQNVIIDESLQHFNERNPKKSYVYLKANNPGFKIHLLSDADTNYLFNMSFDPGKTNGNANVFEDTMTPEYTVLKLISCLTDKKKRNLYIDEWYTSNTLLKKLTDTGYLNTTVLNSKDANSKKDKNKENKDENDGKKNNSFTPNIKSRGTIDYDLEISSIQRNSKRWYTTVLFFGVDASIINAKILFELKTKKSYTTLQFKEKIMENIFKLYKDYKEEYEKNNPVENGGGKKKGEKKIIMNS